MYMGKENPSANYDCKDRSVYSTMMKWREEKSQALKYEWKENGKIYHFIFNFLPTNWLQDRCNRRNVSSRSIKKSSATNSVRLLFEFSTNRSVFITQICVCPKPYWYNFILFQISRCGAAIILLSFELLELRERTTSRGKRRLMYIFIHIFIPFGCLVKSCKRKIDWWKVRTTAASNENQNYAFAITFGLNIKFTGFYSFGCLQFGSFLYLLWIPATDMKNQQRINKKINIQKMHVKPNQCITILFIKFMVDGNKKKKENAALNQVHACTVTYARARQKKVPAFSLCTSFGDCKSH